MSTEKKQPSFQEQLRAKCAEWWADYEAQTAGDTLVTFDWPQVLYDFVKDVALASFKNGVTVGKRKAQDLDGSRRSGTVKE
jgi:hypothetical protein